MSVEKIYWDSDCFLGHFQAEGGKAEKCDGVLKRAERGEVLTVTSALTLAEVLWMRGGPRLPKEKAELVQKFFRRSYIRVYNVTRKISEAAQTHVWDNSIKPKDAIHVATAIHLGADALETFDEKLIGKSGTVGKPLLLIREPQAAVQGRLDLAGPTKTQHEGFEETARQVDGDEAKLNFDLKYIVEGTAEAKVCPECGHAFKGNGWDGIDAHWRSKHEDVMPYEDAWPLLRTGNYKA